MIVWSSTMNETICEYNMQCTSMKKHLFDFLRSFEKKLSDNTGVCIFIPICRRTERRVIMVCRAILCQFSDLYIAKPKWSLYQTIKMYYTHNR